MESINILIVAYYFEPYAGVGAKRISYWASNLHSVEPNYNVHVVTGTTSATPTENYDLTIIENSNSKSLWAKLFRTDKGSSWGEHLIKWFKTSSDKYDVVIFTGGPFLHFRIAKWLKRKMHCKVVFDFRDPMSENPRSNFNNIKLKIKNNIMKIVEWSIVCHADLIISVNSWCLSLIKGVRNKKTAIIDNGFDERIINYILYTKNQNNSKKIKFVYAGSIYEDRNPVKMLNVISKNELLKEKVEFVHLGIKSDLLIPYRGSSWLIELGEKSYKEALEVIAACDYGMVFTLGHPFESTTKIFDYIGLNKHVLIIANSIPTNGALVNLANKYPFIEWVYNNEKAIEKHLKNNIYKEKNNIVFNANEFSRKESLLKLVDEIKKILEK